MKDSREHEIVASRSARESSERTLIVQNADSARIHLSSSYTSENNGAASYRNNEMAHQLQQQE